MTLGSPARRSPVRVVEDELLLRLYAGDFLEAAGFEVVDAPHARAALDIWRVGSNCEEISFRDRLRARNPLKLRGHSVQEKLCLFHKTDWGSWGDSNLSPPRV